MKIERPDYVCFRNLLRRGTGEVIAEEEDALYLRDSVCEGYFLACEDPEAGMEVLERYVDDTCRLLMVTGQKLGEAAYERFGFTGMIDCGQFVYPGDRIETDGALTLRTAVREDVPLLLAHYDHISEQEMEKSVDLGNVQLGCVDGALIGFMGEHLEGSMGMLHIFSEYRRRGYASAMERAIIRRMLDRGLIPYGHVEWDNDASLRLQKKLGMEQCDVRIRWMWR